MTNRLKYIVKKVGNRFVEQTKVVPAKPTTEASKPATQFKTVPTITQNAEVQKLQAELDKAKKQLAITRKALDGYGYYSKKGSATTATNDKASPVDSEKTYFILNGCGSYYLAYREGCAMMLDFTGSWSWILNFDPAPFGKPSPLDALKLTQAEFNKLVESKLTYKQLRTQYRICMPTKFDMNANAYERFTACKLDFKNAVQLKAK